eukprot:m51a1_g7875 hypothetical protein (585) ;mRNA; r:24542-27776
MLSTWKSCREQDKLIRGMLYDQRKRAEQRNAAVAAKNVDPMSSLGWRVVGHKVPLIPDDAQHAANERGDTLMAWQGHEDNMIDRFDGRALLDHIPAYVARPSASSASSSSASSSSASASSEELESMLNFERYQDLMRCARAGVSEADQLAYVQAGLAAIDAEATAGVSEADQLAYVQAGLAAIDAEATSALRPRTTPAAPAPAQPAAAPAAPPGPAAGGAGQGQFAAVGHTYEGTETVAAPLDAEAEEGREEREGGDEGTAARGRRLTIAWLEGVVTGTRQEQADADAEYARDWGVADFCRIARGALAEHDEKLRMREADALYREQTKGMTKRERRRFREREGLKKSFWDRDEERRTRRSSPTYDPFDRSSDDEDDDSGDNDNGPAKPPQPQPQPQQQHQGDGIQYITEFSCGTAVVGAGDAKEAAAAPPAAQRARPSPREIMARAAAAKCAPAVPSLPAAAAATAAVAAPVGLPAVARAAAGTQGTAGAASMAGLTPQERLKLRMRMQLNKTSTAVLEEVVALALAPQAQQPQQPQPQQLLAPLPLPLSVPLAAAVKGAAEVAVEVSVAVALEARQWLQKAVQ